MAFFKIVQVISHQKLSFKCQNIMKTIIITNDSSEAPERVILALQVRQTMLCIFVEYLHHLLIIFTV